MDRPNRKAHVQTVVPEAKERAIHQQLERLFASPFFSRSKRYRDFLRFIVEESLSGRAEGIKERTVGIEVFGRRADYDTNSDPIVRVAAGEIRKRIAQYYIEPSHASELRIEVHPGSYVPEFHWPTASPSALKDQPAFHGRLQGTASNESATGGRVPTELTALRSWPLRATMWAGLACVLAFLFVFILHRPDSPPNLVGEFWSQFAKSSGPVVICPGVISETQPHSGVFPSDVGAVVGIENSLRSIKSQYRVVSYPSADTADFRTGPDVFVGPWHNKWVLRLTGSMRFKFESDASTGDVWIRDTRSHVRWVVHKALPPEIWPDTRRTFTYGILARFWDTSLGRPVVIVAGLTPQGTMAAEDAMRDPKYLKALVGKLPQNWQKMNLESVIGARLVNGKPASTVVEAYYLWR